MQVGPNVKCMHTNFGGRGYSGFGVIATLQNSQISFSDHGPKKFQKNSKKVHGSQKIESHRINSKNSCK